MNEQAARPEHVFPLRPLRGKRRVVAAAQGLVMAAVGEVIVLGVLISDGSPVSSRPTEIALIAIGALFVLVWLATVVAAPARAQKFDVVVSSAGVDLPSTILAHRVRVSWADLMSVTEHRTGVIAWTWRAPGRGDAVLTRRLMTGPRVDNPGLFAVLSAFRQDKSHRAMLDRWCST